MICTAGLFAVLNGLIVISVLTGSSGRQRYKDMMDKVVGMLRSKNVPPELGRRVLRYVLQGLGRGERRVLRCVGGGWEGAEGLCMSMVVWRYM